MSKRILVVEDDDAIRDIARMTLEALGGHTVLAVDSGQRALAEAEAFAPDLLLLDVQMPEMDGPETLVRLRERQSLAGLPAAFLTAATQPREVDRYRRLGVEDVIAKPFDPALLCERVAALLVAAPPSPAAVEQAIALVVEDDPSIRYLLDFILRQQGYGVREAIDGDAGAAAIDDGAPTDVVVLDIMLPGIDGLSLLRRLRADRRWDATPVVMLTAHGSESQVAAALDIGADDYLGKPFDPADLLERLRRLRAGRRQ